MTRKTIMKQARTQTSKRPVGKQKEGPVTIGRTLIYTAGFSLQDCILALKHEDAIGESPGKEDGILARGKNDIYLIPKIAMLRWVFSDPETRTPKTIKGIIGIFEQAGYRDISEKMVYKWKDTPEFIERTQALLKKKLFSIEAQLASSVTILNLVGKGNFPATKWYHEKVLAHNAGADDEDLDLEKMHEEAKKLQGEGLCKNPMRVVVGKKEESA